MYRVNILSYPLDCNQMFRALPRRAELLRTPSRRPPPTRPPNSIRISPNRSRRISGCRGNGEEDRRVSPRLPTDRETFVDFVLQHHRPAKHRPHVPVLSVLVPEPLFDVHPRQVQFNDYNFICRVQL